jgi:AcrB/AcrD/AcrF family
MSFLGTISLIGMVIRNSVILIDQIETEIRNGQHPWNEVIGATQHRLRPILLTVHRKWGVTPFSYWRDPIFLPKPRRLPGVANFGNGTPGALRETTAPATPASCSSAKAAHVGRATKIAGLPNVAFHPAIVRPQYDGYPRGRSEV